MLKNRMVKAVGIGAGLSMLAGAGTGFIFESHTNEIAASKVRTVEGCLRMYPIQTENGSGATISEQLSGCFHTEAKSVDPVEKEFLKQGEPAAFVEVYLQDQRLDSENIEANRIAIWPVMPLGAAAVVVVVGLNFV